MAPKVKKYTEKVICLIFRKEMIYENLEAHNKNKHEGEKLNYKSAHSRDLLSLISKKGEVYGDTSSTPEEKMEEEGLLSPCHQTNEDVEPPLKVLCLDPPIKKELNKSVNAKLEEITSKLTHFLHKSSNLQVLVANILN